MCLPVIDEASHPRPHPGACHIVAATTLLSTLHLPPEDVNLNVSITTESHQFAFTLILPQVGETFSQGFEPLLVLMPQTGESEAALQQTIGLSFRNPQMDFLKLAFSSSGSLDTLPICSIFAQSSPHRLISTQVCSVVHLFGTQPTVFAHRIKTTGTRRKIISEIRFGHLWKINWKRSSPKVGNRIVQQRLSVMDEHPG